MVRKMSCGALVVCSGVHAVRDVGAGGGARAEFECQRVGVPDGVLGR